MIRRSLRLPRCNIVVNTLINLCDESHWVYFAPRSVGSLGILRVTTIEHVQAPENDEIADRNFAVHRIDN